MKITDITIFYSLEDSNVICLSTFRRKTRAHKIINDCKRYISHQIFSEDLLLQIQTLQLENPTLSTYESIEILLDFAQDKLEAN